MHLWKNIYNMTLFSFPLSIRRSDVRVSSHFLEDTSAGLMLASCREVWICTFMRSGWILENWLQLNRWKKSLVWSQSVEFRRFHSPSPAEDEGVLDGHQRSELRTLWVMVLATVITPCDTHHTCHHCTSHTLSHIHIRAGLILTDKLIWRLLSHYVSLQTEENIHNITCH